MSKPLKAYEVYDGGDGWSIQFATNSATARREGANDIGCEWGDIDHCRRLPELDQYAPGPVPARAMLDAGWWFECSHCGTQVFGDHEGHIAEGQTVYCSERCSQAEWLQLRANERAKVDLIELFESKFEGCQINYVHVYGQRLEPRDKHGGARASVSFMFPGGKYGATFEYGDDHVWVTQHDQEAWHAWRAQAARQDGAESAGGEA